MKIFISKLELIFKKAHVTVPFDELTYFYGQMGSGKTSIARLIDYCLGGNLELSTALQSEFVSATLYLIINNDTKDARIHSTLPRARSLRMTNPTILNVLKQLFSLHGISSIISDPHVLMCFLYSYSWINLLLQINIDEKSHESLPRVVPGISYG